MHLFKYIAAFWAAIAVYSMISLFSGATGISAQNQLRSEKERMEQNLHNLTLINEELENTKRSLTDDPDTLTVHARQLGYGKEDEKHIRIIGLGGLRNPHTEAGQAVFAEPPQSISDVTIKIIALCSALAVFAFLLFCDLRKQ